MSTDLVPGWMRRLALVSMAVCSIWAAWRAASGPIIGDLGPIWISAGGGGLGSRGELGGNDIATWNSIRDSDTSAMSKARVVCRGCRDPAAPCDPDGSEPDLHS